MATVPDADKVSMLENAIHLTTRRVWFQAMVKRASTRDMNRNTQRSAAQATGGRAMTTIEQRQHMQLLQH